MVTINVLIENLVNQVGYERILSGLLSLLLLFVFVTEFYKFIKYRSLSDILELSGAGFLITLLFAFTGDLLLSGLAGLLAIMLVGVYEVRESPIWFRLMGSFAISYIWFFIFTLFGFLLKSETLSSFGYSTLIFVMVFSAFLFFGRKFIIVTRFISPQMVYLIFYIVVMLIIINLDFLEWQIAYPLIFLVNVFIYLISGYLLQFLFGIKDLEDERVLKLINEVQTKIDTPVKRVGIVKAPILNAFAYGPWFDQRMAYIAEDIDQFTDEEILGITAHEMAHLKKKHTLWLLGITAIEFIIKRLLGAPIHYLDIALNQSTWNFLDYFIFNMVLFAFLLTIVKSLEGQADRITGEAGYGRNLMESLYRLEGFYYGIAGEIGLNAQLLTGNKRTHDEEIRFMGNQAKHLYNGLKPSRLTGFFNLIASHPLTSIRFVSQLDSSIKPYKVGLMTWMLLIPGLRGRTLNKLQSYRDPIKEMLTEKFLKDFGTIEDYLENSQEKKWLSQLIGESVLVKPKYKGLKYNHGTITNLVLNSDITSPVLLEINTDDGLMTFPTNNYEFILAEKNQDYFDKKGKINTLINVQIQDGKFKGFVFKTQNGNKTFKKIGFPLKMLNNPDFTLFLRDGAIYPSNLKLLKTNGNLNDLTFEYMDSDGSIKKISGNELIISLPSLIHIPQKRNMQIESKFYSHMMKIGQPVLIYDKEDIDIGRPGIITDFNPEEEFIRFKSGKNTEENLPIKKIDAIILDYPYFMIELKRQIGWASRLTMRLFDRDTKIKYINA